MKDLEAFMERYQNLDSTGVLLNLAQFVLWTVFILLLTWLIRKAINRSIESNSVRYRARKATRLLSYLLIVLLGIITFTGKVQYFSIAIGIISAGLAFALQEVILSIAGWIAIFSAHIYKPGDRIEINEVRGDVIDIGILKTTLMEIGEWTNSDNYTGRIVKVSNAFVFKGSVFNYSTDFPFVWDAIDIPIRYGSDLNLAHKIIMETAQDFLKEYTSFAEAHWQQMVEKYLIENANVAPSLQLALTDNWAAFNLRYVVDYKKRRMTKNALFEAIHQRIQETNGTVTLASATFEVTGLPSVTVSVEKPSSSTKKPR